MPSPIKNDQQDGESTKDKSPLLTRSRTTSPEEPGGGGVDNPVFDPDGDEVGPGAEGSTPVLPVPPVRRRGSAVISMPASSLLAVPKPGMRRHSLAVSPGKLLQVPSPAARGSVSSETEDDNVSIDRLSLPRVPNLSRRSSLRSNWSELEALASRRQSEDSITFHEESRNSSGLSAMMGDKLKILARRFSMRTDRMKEKVIQPATPSTTEKERDETASATSRDDSEEPPEGRQHRLDSFLPGSSMGSAMDKMIDEHYCGIGRCKIRIPAWIDNIPTLGGTFEPQSKLYLSWLAVVTLAYMYNAVACTLRPAFVTAKVQAKGKMVNVCATAENVSQILSTTLLYNNMTDGSLNYTNSFYNSTSAGSSDVTFTVTLPSSRATDDTATLVFESTHRNENISSGITTTYGFSANDTTSAVPDSTPDYGTYSSVSNRYENYTSYESSTPSLIHPQDSTTNSIQLTTLNNTNQTEVGDECMQWNKTFIYYYYKEGYETDENRIYWWICDYICDFIFILDIIFVKNRVQFINNGLLEKDRKETAKYYFSKLEFKLDLAALIPLDLFYLIPAVNYNSLFRLPRLLKIYTLWEFFDRIDQVAKAGYIIRVLRTLVYMMYLIHLETCIYFYMSAYEILGFNEWTYSGQGNSYVRCMYLATKTATSIGNNPDPTNLKEYIFMTVYWLSGVFVFAMLIGQIRDIFQAAGASKTKYRRTMDDTLAYMYRLNLPQGLQKKVRLWFNYTWERQKAINENSLLDGLPTKMRTDMAIHVHFNTLSKVTLFQECDKSLLFDLVTKLQPTLYLPGDYICKKGEVGTEMYIVKEGKVEVVGGPNDSLVFVTLGEGSVFGEISLLALAGGNRRTASVKSKGFSNLFILSKADFEEAMADYPEAQKVLKRKAKKILTKNAKKDKEEDDQKMEAEEVIKRAETPKLVRTVIQVKEAMDPESKLFNKLRRGSRRESTISTLSSKQQSEIKSMVDLKDPDEFEDEILVVEQTERALTPAEKLKFEENETQEKKNEAESKIEGPEKQKDLDEDIKISMGKMTPVETTKDTQSIDSSIEAILNSPKDGNDNSNNSNKVHRKTKVNKSSISATIRYESDFADILESPSPHAGSSKPASKVRLPALRSRKVQPIENTGSSQQQNRKTTSDSNSTSPAIGHQKVAPPYPSKFKAPSAHSNKVAPLPRTNTMSPSGENRKAETSFSKDSPAKVPPENQIVCTVDIHREKSPSVTSSIVSGINSPRD